MALGGQGGATVERLLDDAVRLGSRTVEEISSKALERLLAHGAGSLAAAKLFTDAERLQLTEALAAAMGTAELLGRSLVRDFLRREEEAAGSDQVRESLDGPASAVLIDVPDVRQDTSYSCGAAALEAALKFYGWTYDEAELRRALGTDASGTSAKPIVDLARRLGLDVRAGSLGLAGLLAQLDAGRPVICGVQAEAPDGWDSSHWVVAIGHHDGLIVLQDPLRGRTEEPAEQFVRRWHDYDDGQPQVFLGLAIGKPGSLHESLLFEALTNDPVPIVSPEQAIEYFRGLVPTLGTDPLRFGPDLRRRAFTIAGSTETDLLTKVQDLIRGFLDTGEEVSAKPSLIQSLLDQAGVSTKNPQRAEMIFRTNAMDAYNRGAFDEMRDPEVAPAFPVWMYSAIVDSRSRPEHAARNGNYYPAEVEFDEVRGTDIEEVANCRCTFIPISKWKWRRLKAAGAAIADGYPDVTLAA